MARRSIYSRRQAQAPGTYETPLADFLDAIPGYVNQYQQNQLQLDKQALQEKRYDDAIKQRDYTNELNLYKLLPDDVRSAAMSKSENEDISQIGTKAVNNNKAFLDQLNFTDMSKSDVDMLDYYDNLLTSPNVAGNTKRENQIKNKIISQQNKIKKESIVKYYDDNPDSKFKNIDLQRAQYEPDEVIKDLNDRTLKSISNELPPLGATLEALSKMLTTKTQEKRLYKSAMTAQEVNDLTTEIGNIESRIEEITGLGEPKLRLPKFTSTKQESTKKSIPGF
jgi:hypothetical protein